MSDLQRKADRILMTPGAQAAELRRLRQRIAAELQDYVLMWGPSESALAEIVRVIEEAERRGREGV